MNLFRERKTSPAAKPAGLSLSVAPTLAMADKRVAERNVFNLTLQRSRRLEIWEVGCLRLFTGLKDCRCGLPSAPCLAGTLQAKRF